MWVGALIGLLLAGGVGWVGLAAGGHAQWALLALVVLVVVLISVPVTRRWGIGVLIGVAVAVPLSLIVFAGVCIAWFASSTQAG